MMLSWIWLERRISPGHTEYTIQDLEKRSEVMASPSVVAEWGSTDKTFLPALFYYQIVNTCESRYAGTAHGEHRIMY